MEYAYFLKAQPFIREYHQKKSLETPKSQSVKNLDNESNSLNKN